MSNKPSLPQEVFLLPPDFLSRGPQHQGTRARHESKVKVERPLLEQGEDVSHGGTEGEDDSAFESQSHLESPSCALSRHCLLRVFKSFYKSSCSIFSNSNKAGIWSPNNSG